ncbi:MAG: hypothetical protein IPK10_16660 [Bacteroidetes bacterium]|nr:hypothetical protein [Bacteroidota bacterium]
MTDGTEAGTRLLKDIRPGTGSSNPHSLIAVGPKLYFFADDGAAGNEIWSSDGTEFGTNGLSNINSGSSGQSNTTVITEYDGKAYFRGTRINRNGVICCRRFRRHNLI